MICKCVVEATYLDHTEDGKYIVRCARCKKPKHKEPKFDEMPTKIALSSYYGKFNK